MLFTCETRKIKSFVIKSLISFNLFYLFIFKGSVSRDFLSLSFSWFETIGVPDKQTKIFSNSFSISPRYSIFSKLCGVHHDHTPKSVSEVWCILRTQTPQRASHSGVKKTKYLKKLRSVHPTTESFSAVCIILYGTLELFKL